MTTANTKFGSTKSVSSSGMQGLVMFNDGGDSSIYDLGAMPGARSSVIARARIRQTIAIFRYLQRRGVLTHFERVGNDDTSFLARECSIPNQPLLSGAADMRHTNVELLWRIRATQKFYDRVMRGEVPIEDIALYPGDTFKPGVRFAKPYVEVSSKWLATDVYLKKPEAAEFAKLTLAQTDMLYREGGSVGGLIIKMLMDLGFTPFDGKLEFAFNEILGQLYLIDTVTLDEMGLERGGQLYGKNPYRFEYQARFPEWYAELKAAQKAYPDDKSQWPTYPGEPTPELLHAQEVKYTRAGDEFAEYEARMH